MGDAETKIVDVDDVYMTTDDLFEYEGRPFTGMTREVSPDGVVIGELSYVDGMLDGVARTWYPSGQLREEEHFRANGRHGPSSIPSPSGTSSGTRTVS
jgi:antitoxin component YwqK of YwqJK toxin-antitoxin module